MAFERHYVTSRGKMLEARVHAGETIEFTRMRIGSGQLADGQSIEALTDLIQPIKYIPISKVKSSGSKAVVMGGITNFDISSSFYFREIGLYAIDPVEGEILYAYANAGSNADFIPAYSTTPVEFTFSFNIVFTNTSNVTITADTSLGFVTNAALDEALAEKPSRYLFDVTIPTTGWSAYQGSLYSLSIPVEGIRADDTSGNIGPTQTGIESEDKEIRRAWNRITRIQAAQGGIIVYAAKIPTTSIPIRMELFR